MPINIKGLIEKRSKLYAELDGMLKACQTETRAFNEAENNRYSEIMTELRSIENTLEAAEVAEKAEKKETKPAGGTEERSQEALEERAFECYIRGIMADTETRTAVNMTVGDNGALIPSTIAKKIIEEVKELSPLYQRATHYNVGGDLVIPVYDESTQKIQMAYATEFTALTSTAGKTTSVTLHGFLAGALSKVSLSLINNNEFDLVPFVIHRMAMAVAEWIETELINGTPNKIEGLSTLTAAVTAVSATAVTADELIDLQETIPDALQNGCIWIMSRQTRKAIRKLKDGQNNYLLNKDATAKWGYSLFGHDVYVSEGMPDMAAGKVAIVYGDPTGLAVKTSEKASVQVLREKFVDEHAVGVICWLEMDSKVENKQKFATLKMKAS